MSHDELHVNERGVLTVVSVPDEGDPAPQSKPDPLDHDFDGKKGGSLPKAARKAKAKR